MSSIKIAIVEDNADILRNLQLIFSFYPGLYVQRTYGSAEDLIADFDSLDIDVAVMDINLPGLSGVKAVEMLKPQRPEVQFLMCTIYDDDENIYHSLCAGAAGYLLKNTPPEKFLEAIKDIHAGGSPMSPNIARKVVTAFQNRHKPNPDYENLSAREKEILDRLGRGFRYKEIADQLNISIETVRTHIRNIYDKLQVNSRTEALNKIAGH